MLHCLCKPLSIPLSFSLTILLPGGMFNALVGPLISHFAYNANQGRTLIVYSMDYQGHIEDVFLPTLNLFFSGLTAFQGHNGKLKIPSLHDNYLQKWTISFSEINLLQLLSFYWLTTFSRCTPKKKRQIIQSCICQVEKKSIPIPHLFALLFLFFQFHNESSTGSPLLGNSLALHSASVQ